MAKSTYFKPRPDVLWRELTWHFPDPEHPDVIWLTFGAWMRYFQVRPPNMSGMTRDDRGFYALRFNADIRGFGSRWSLYFHHFIDDATDYITAPMPCLGAELVDADREVAFRSGMLKDHRYYIGLIYQPPPDVANRLTRLMVRNDPNRKGPDYRTELRKFIDETDSFLSALEYMPVCEPLSGDDLATFLAGFVQVDGPARVRMPSYRHDLRGRLCNAPFEGGYNPALGTTWHHPETGAVLGSNKEYIYVVSLHEYPDEMGDNALDRLNELPFSLYVTARWFPLDRHQAKMTLQEFWRQYYRSRKGMLDQALEAFTKKESPVVNHEALKRAREADELSDKLSDGAVSLGYFGTVIVVRHRDPAVAFERANDVFKKLRNMGFTGEIEGINAAEAFLGSIPGCVYHDVNRPGVDSSVVACALPLDGVDPGPTETPYLRGPPTLYVRTRGQSRKRLSLFDDDLGHRTLVGMSGGGKTFAMNLLSSQDLKFPNMRVIQFGRKGGGVVPALCHGGSIIDPALGEFSVQPLRHADKYAKDCHNWVINTLSLTDAQMARDHEVDDAVWAALQDLAEKKVERRTITVFRSLAAHPFIKDGLARFAKGGSCGHLTDGVANFELDAVWQYFELDTLLKNPLAQAPVMSALMFEVDRLLDSGVRLSISFDELWMFGKVNDLIGDTAGSVDPFMDELEDRIRSYRSKGGHVTLATQQAADLETHRNVILGNCPFLFFVPGPDTKTAGGVQALRRVGLEMDHIQLLQNAHRKRDYLLKSPNGIEMIDFCCSPVQAAIVGSGDKEHLLDVPEVLERYGRDRFLYGWMKRWEDYSLKRNRHEDARRFATAARWVAKRQAAEAEPILPAKEMIDA